MQLKSTAHYPEVERYSTINSDEKAVKTTCIFFERWQSHHDFVLSSQALLIEGKGFKESMVEKMRDANVNMSIGIIVIDDFIHTEQERGI